VVALGVAHCDQAGLLQPLNRLGEGGPLADVDDLILAQSLISRCRP
jgi:hypothetical protein